MAKLDLPAWISGFDRKLLLDYVNGMKPKEIYAKYGVDANFLSQVRYRYKIPAQVELRSLGILPPLKHNTATKTIEKCERDQRYVDAVAEYAKTPGKIPILALSKKYHISQLNLSKAIKASGVPVKRGPTKCAHRNNELSERNQNIVDAVIKEGKTYDAVAKEQDPPLTRQRVEQIVKRAGFSAKQRTPEAMAVLKQHRLENRYKHAEEEEIIEVLRAGKLQPKRIREKFGVTDQYLRTLRVLFDIPLSNRLNWRSDAVIQRERLAIDYYYNRPDKTVAWISKHILESKNPASVVQLVERRGLERTRGKLRFGPTYTPSVKPRKKYSNKFKLKVLDEYRQSGLTITELLQRHGIAYETLKRWREAFQLEPRIGQPKPAKRKTRTGASNCKMNAEELAALDKVLNDGFRDKKSLKQLARDSGYSYGKLQRRSYRLDLDFANLYKESRVSK